MNLSDLRELLAKLSPSWDVQRSMQPDFGSGLADKEAAFVNPDTQAAEAAARQAEVDQAFKWPAIMAATLNAVPGLPAAGAAVGMRTAGMPRRPKAPPAPLTPEPVPQAPPKRIEPGMLAAAKAGNERAIEEILQVVRPMVRATGAKYGKLGPDAMQEANLIVLRNIQNAPEQPSHFMAAVRKELRNVGREIDPLREAAPLSRETRELLGRVERFKQQYYQKYGVQLADDRVIKKMGLSEFEQQALRDAYASPARAPKVELDKPRFDDTSEGFHSVTAQHEDASRSTPSVEGETAGQIPTPAEQLAQKDYRAAISFALRRARQEDPRRADIWAAYEAGKTEAEIGKQFGVSHVAIHKAIQAMRDRLAAIARARIEGQEAPAPLRKKPGGSGPAKPLNPKDQKPPIQGGSGEQSAPYAASPEDLLEYAHYQEGFGPIQGFHNWHLRRPVGQHPAGTTLSEQTLRELGITPPEPPQMRPPIRGGSGPEPTAFNVGEEVTLLHDPNRKGVITQMMERNGQRYWQIREPHDSPGGYIHTFVPEDQLVRTQPPGPKSVGAAAYQDPAQDVDRWVDDYRRFVNRGGLDKEPDPEIVRQLQNPNQYTQPVSSGISDTDSMAMYRWLHAGGEPREAVQERDQQAIMSDQPYWRSHPMEGDTRVTVPAYSNRIDPETGRPVSKAGKFPIIDFREDVIIPRPMPRRGVPPKLGGAGAAGSDYTTPLDPDQRAQLKAANDLAARYSGGTSFDNTKFGPQSPAQMLRIDPEQMRLNAWKLSDVIPPHQQNVDELNLPAFNDPEAFQQYIRDLLRLNTGH